MRFYRKADILYPANRHRLVGLRPRHQILLGMNAKMLNLAFWFHEGVDVAGQDHG
jgi:hypothetical protein